MSAVEWVFFACGLVWALVGIWFCVALDRHTNGRAAAWVADSPANTTAAVVLWPLLAAGLFLYWLTGFFTDRGRY